jgi:hypothetical protein
MVGHALISFGAWALALSAVNGLPSTSGIKPRLITESLKSGRASVPVVKITDSKQESSGMTSAVDVGSK